MKAIQFYCCILLTSIFCSACSENTSVGNLVTKSGTLPSTNTAKTEMHFDGIDTVIKQVGFKVKQPSELPFKVTNANATVTSLSNGQKELVIIYSDNSTKQSLIETVDEGNRQSAGNAVKLPNGIVANYEESKSGSIIGWNERNLFYFLQSSRLRDGKMSSDLTKDQLIKVVNSMN